MKQRYTEMRAPKPLPFRRAAVCMLLFSFIFSPLAALGQESGDQIISDTDAGESSEAPIDTPQQDSEESDSGPETDSNSDDGGMGEDVSEPEFEDPEARGGLEPEPQFVEVDDGDSGRISKNITNDRRFAEVDESSGALKYSIPIESPTGRNGIQPNLQLDYLSQSLDESSAVGYGWKLNIPYIERRNLTGVEDMYSQQYFFSSLSGELATTSTSTYRAKIDDASFLKYEFTNNAWTVSDKQGNTYKFGSSSDAKISSSATSTDSYRWMLEEVRDSNGNYITYEYLKDGGQSYPDRISYTNYGSSDGPFEIEFTYETKSDVSTSTAYGFGVVTSQRLSTIVVRENGSWVRKYDLDYTLGDNDRRELLDTVTKSGKDEAGSIIELPAIDFSYATTSTTTWSGSAFPYTLEYKEAVRYGDINGDGRTDILYSNENRHEYKRIYLNKGGGTWESIDGANIPVFFFWASNSSGSSDSALYSRLVDLNGDLLADIYDANSGEAFINNGDLTWTIAPGWFYEPTYAESVQLADLNGDRLVDLVYSWKLRGTSGVTQGIKLNTGTGWGPDESTVGLPDYEFFWVSNSSCCKDKITTISMVDVNGDGLADLSTLDDGVSLNMGNLTWTPAPSWAFTPPNERNAIRYGDINNDGLVDLISSYKESNQAKQIHVYINQGDRWLEDTNWAVNFPTLFYWYPNSSQNPSRNYDVGLADFDGDGVMDILDGSDVIVSSGNHVDLLTGIENELNGNTTITYSQSALEMQSGALNNPSLPINANIVKNISDKDTVGTDEETTYEYKGGDYYFESYLNRKFSGFESISELKDGKIKTTYFHQGNNTSTTTNESSDNYAKIGKPYRLEIRDGGNALYSVQIKNWQNATSTNTQLVTATSSVMMMYDGNGTHADSAETYTYDGKGNLVSKTQWGAVTATSSGAFTDIGTDLRITDYTYASTSSSTISSLASVLLKDQNLLRASESLYYYDNLALGEISKGNKTKEARWISGSIYASSTNSYNSFGLISSSTDWLGNATTRSYDSYNLYPATITNPLSQSTNYSYEYSTGKPKETTDPNGSVIKVTYDALGRIKQKKQSDPTSSSTLVIAEEYDYYDNTQPFKVKKSEYLGGGPNKDSYYYFDGKSRPIQIRSSSEQSGTFNTIDIAYSKRGLKAKNSLPYASNGLSRTSPSSVQDLYTSYAYDPLDRVVAEKNAVGTTTHAFDDQVETVTDANGKVKSFTRDTFGLLTRVDEHLGTSTYSTLYGYDAIGNLATVTDSIGNVRSFAYDGFGNRLSAQDLHATGDSTFGIWSMLYDANGNVTRSTNPKGQVVNYTYDSLSRIATEDYTGNAGYEVTNTYDACTGGIGKLCGVVTPDISTAYTYASNGNVASESKIVGTTTYSQIRTYDRQGNVASITYPDGSKTEYVYNDANLIDSVTFTGAGSASSTVISSIDYDPASQPLSIRYGAAATSTYKYDNEKLYRLTNKTSSSTSAVLQKLSYEYDSVGNITKVIEGSGGPVSRIVNYSYDDLYRLALASTSDTAYGLATTSTTSPYAYGRDYFLKLSIPGTHASGTQTNIPVYVDLADMPASFFAHASSTCEDIRVFARNRTTELPREIVSCDTVNKTGEMHFKADLISSASTTNDFYIHYGTTTPFTVPARNSTYGADNVWTNYGVVYHLNQDPGGTAPQLKDSTLNQRNATTEGGMSGNQAMKVGKGISFDDSNDAATFSNVVPGTNAFVISMWALETGEGILFSAVDDNLIQFFISMDTSLAAGMNWRVSGVDKYLNTGTGSGYNNGVPRYIQVSLANNGAYNHARMEIYSNGQLVASNEDNAYSYNIPTLARGWFLGKIKDYKKGTNKSFYGGSLDEVRYFNGTTTPSRVLTEYNNQASTTAFYAVGAEEIPSATATTTILLATSSYAYKVNYAYDQLGNMSSSSDTGIYTYGQTGYANPHAPTQVASTTYTYDENGNLTAAGAISNSWDYRNRLVQTQTGSSTISYVYDQRDDRMKYSAGTTTILSPFNEYEVNGGKIRRNVYLGDQLLATVETIGTTTNIYYVLTDHLQGTNVVINESGNLVEYLDYAPFGKVSVDQKVNGFSEGKKYVGQDYDSESQLSYLNARYYDGARGQFLSQDPVFWEVGQTADGVSVLSNPQLQNSYSYAANNPITNKDPNGRHPGIIAGAIIGGGIGFGAQLVSDGLSGQVSSWHDYAGATVGGAVGGAVIGSGVGLVTLAAGGALGGLTQGVTREGLDYASGEGAEYGSIANDTVFGAVGSVAGGVLASKVGVPAIKGITVGRGSMSSVAKQINTKLSNGTISNTSLKTQGKMIVAAGANSVYDAGIQVGQNIASSYSQTVGNIQKQINNLQKQVSQMKGSR